MTQREFVEAGIKLIGCYILFLGLLALISSTSTMVTCYAKLKANPRAHHIGLFSVGLSCAVDQAVTLEDSQVSLYWMESPYRMAVALLKTLFGLYLCKRGKWIVCFLIGKEHVTSTKPEVGPCLE